MSMLQVMRLRPHIQIGICIAVCAFILNATLEVLAITPALRWLPEKVTGNGFTEDGRQKVSSVIQEYQDGRIDPRKYLGVVVGISNVREGIDLQALSAEAGEGWRFLGIAGAGAGIESVEENANVILDSALRPDLVFLGLNSIIILDTGLMANIGTIDAKVKPRNSLIDNLKSWTWIYSRRKDISLSMEDVLLSIRASTFKVFGVRLVALDPRSPWREMLKLMGAEHYPDSQLRGGLLRAEAAGAFDRNAYVSSVDVRAILQRILKRFHDRGTRVIVALMPEHSYLVTREPKGSGDYLKTALMESVPGQDIQFFDYRGAIDDSGFVDLVHLNTVGRSQFSRILGQDIRHIKFGRAPQMSVRR